MTTPHPAPPRRRLRPVLGALAALCALRLAAAGAPGWAHVSDLPRGVAGHAAAIDDRGEWWILGGTYWEAGAKHLESAIARRPAEGSWTRAGTLAAGFAYGAAAHAEDALWLAGGAAADGASRAIHRLDLRTGAVRAPGTLPEPRLLAGGAMHEGRLWVVGGTARDGDFTGLPTTVLRVDPATGQTGRLVTPLPGLVSPLVLVFGRELHVLPGSQWSAERKRLEATDRVWIYSAADERWRERRLARPLPRSLAGIALDARRALLVGGVDHATGSIVRSAWIYHVATGELAPLPDLPAPRLAPAVLADRSHVFVLGGEDAPRQRARAIWRIPRP